MIKTTLTDFQAWAVTNAIDTWNQKNKAKTDPFLDLSFFKKLFAIKNALRPTVEAISETKISVSDLYAKKETTEYQLEKLSEDECEKAGLLDGIDTLEIFSWIM